MNQLAPKPLAGVAKARFTAAEFAEMVAIGSFTGMKVDLIDGELERMNPPMSGHGSRQAMTIARLWVLCGDRVIGEVGVRLGDDTVLGCDLAVLREPIAGNRLLEPADLLLVIEIAETTLDRDLGIKRRKYAEAGIAHYWVVDGARSVTHVYGEPIDGDYAQVTTVRFAEPLAVPGTDAAITLA